MLLTRNRMMTMPQTKIKEPRGKARLRVGKREVVVLLTLH